jgi:uroporphyrinogen decarboxylase
MSEAHFEVGQGGMMPRERLLSIFEHKEPDRVPFDAWISPAFHLKLRSQLGSAELERLSPDLWLGVRGIGPGVSDVFARRGAVVNPFIHYGIGIPVDEVTLEDEWGIRRSLTSYGTESRIVQHPLKGADMESLENYKFPDPYAAGRFKISRRDIAALKERFLISGSFGCDTFWSQAWYLRGFNRLVTDLYSNPEFFERLMGRLLEYYIGIGEQLVELGMDVLCMADDIAMQTGPIISPRLWRKHVKPYYKALIDAVRPKVEYVYYHSDGDLSSIIPDLIELGVDILNSVQPECVDLDQLKGLYGDKLTLWGAFRFRGSCPTGL